MSTVLREYLRPQRQNKSSRLGPKSSITMALYFPPHIPKWYTLGMPSGQKKHDRLISLLQSNAKHRHLTKINRRQKILMLKVF